MKTTLDIILPYDPCPEACTWAAFNTDPKLAWETCLEPIWMAWIAGNLRVDGKLRALAACKCAKATLDLIPEKGDVPRKTVETIEAFLQEKASMLDVKEMQFYIRRMSHHIVKLPFTYVHHTLWTIDMAARAALTAFSPDWSVDMCATVQHATNAAKAAGMDLKVIADIIRSVLTWDVMSRHI